MDSLIENGQPAPQFSLLDLNGTLHHLEDLRGRVAVLNFWSAECPWSERADQELENYRSVWGNEVSVWRLASNLNESIELLRRVATERGFPLVLHDQDSRVADLYCAQTTPHLFVLDREGVLRYQGALNDITFRQRTATRFYLRQAVEAVLAGQQPDPALTPPYGCTIVRTLVA